MNGCPLTYFAINCGKDTLISVLGDDDVEVPLIFQRGKKKE